MAVDTSKKTVLPAVFLSQLIRRFIQLFGVILYLLDGGNSILHAFWSSAKNIFIDPDASGQTFVDPSVAGKLLTHIAGTTVLHDTTLGDTLSPREREVLRSLASGLSNVDIAKQLFLSEGTVRNYVSGIFIKLGVTDRTQAAIIALRHGLAD